MAYNIPQELRYKEIFAYGMTIRQFLYMTLFGIISIEILSNGGIPKEVGALAALLLMSFAILLGFLDLDKKILELLSFLRTPKNITPLSKEAQTLGIKYLQDSTIILPDNMIVAVLKVDALNFSILSKEQKEAVIQNFMNFLNSLAFPIQIIMRTVTLDMSEYLKNLQARSEGTESLESDNLKEFLENYVKENKVTDKVFYITIPLKKQRGLNSEEISFRGLSERVEVVREWLVKSLLKSRRLGNKSLLSFLASFYSEELADIELPSSFTCKK